MASLLKDEFNPDFLGSVGSSIESNFPEFDTKSFVAISKTGDWKKSGLKERMRACTLKLNTLLPINYSEQMDILEKAGSEYRGLQGMLFPDFVEVFGLEDVERSLDALEFLTEFSTGEFAIRPLIVKYPKIVLKRMLAWTSSSNEHHRRLASEGCRPRLPWGLVLKNFVVDPSPILKILEPLKADESKYVQKSVANNLNDLTKDHSDLFIDLARRWGLEQPNTAWILKHASRTLLKKGHPKVLEMFGYPQTDQLVIESMKMTPTGYSIGDQGQFLATLKNTGKTDLNFRAEYIVHYPRQKEGSMYDKVFYIKESSLEPNGTVTLSGKLDFEKKSTRKIYGGEHGLSIQVNGKKIFHQSILVK